MKVSLNPDEEVVKKLKMVLKRRVDIVRARCPAQRKTNVCARNFVSR